AELFPLISAPFIRWFGLRGAYVLPAAGFLGILVGCAWLAVALDRTRKPSVVLVVAGLATPLLFYGLEFWEHSLALAFAVSATAMLVVSFEKKRGAAMSLALGAGVAFGLAVNLRPETAWVFV